MITISIMLATIIQALDGTIANVALPHMQGSLSASQDQITWVLTSFIVAAAIATPLTGWLTDRFGLKNVFLTSVAGFTVASVLCGLSGSLAQIVAARLLQGVFGASLVPLSQAVLLDINPREKHGSAMAVWGMGVMIGPILGPTLGGWLTDSYNWRWVFFINVPVGALAFYGIWKYIRKVPAARNMRFDMFGFATLSLAIGALQMLLDRGEQNDWFASRETWVEAVLLAITLSYFVAHTILMPAGKSFFDYRLLKNRNYVTGLLFIFIVGLVLFATRALTPTMLQGLMDYPAAISGLVTAPSGFGTMVAMLVVGPPGRQGRFAPAARYRLCHHCFFLVADEPIHAGAQPERHRVARRDPGRRPRPGLRAAECRDLRHAVARHARRRHCHLQPAAQCRQQHRHRPRAGPAGAQYADRALLAGHANHQQQCRAER